MLDPAQVAKDLAAISPTTELPITYRTHTGETAGNAALGIPGSTSYTDTPDKANTRAMSLREISMSQGVYQTGDRLFWLRRTEMSNRDRIVFEGAEWQILEMQSVTVAGQVMQWTVKARRI